MAYPVTTRACPPQTMYVLPSCDVHEPYGQRLLRKVLSDGLDLRCGCRPTRSSPLSFRRGTSGRLHPVKRPNTEGEHSYRCPHGPGGGSLSASLGLPSASIREVQGRIELNLQALFSVPAPPPGGTGGTWQGLREDHLPRVYSLAWYLLYEAGLTYWTPDSRDPWQALQRATRNIGIAGSKDSLETRMLLPTGICGNSSKANWRKLYRVLPKGRKERATLLFASLLPPAGGPRYTLLGDLGADLELRLFNNRLGATLAKCVAAASHRAAGRPVLVVGSVKVKNNMAAGASNPRLHKRIDQFVLIPVADVLAPTPTPKKWDELEFARRASKAYCVYPEDDAILSLRCRPSIKQVAEHSMAGAAE
jgi:hypothetical protein